MCGHILKIYHSTAVCIVEFTGHLLSDRDTTSSTGMEAEVNVNKTRLNLGLGMGMGMNHLE